MASTEVGLCNLALVFVGHASPISSLNDNTAAARACKSVYESARDELLEKHNWKFARKHAVLGLLSGVERSAWAYCYELPVDCIAPRSVWPGTRTPTEDEKIPFDWEAGDSGPSILVTDEPEAELEYTAKVTTVGLYSPGFVKALAWAIAVELCLVLPIDDDKAMKVDLKARRALLEAKAAIDTTGKKDPAPLSEYETGR